MADRITSPDQLKALAAKAKADIDLREGRKETQVTVHMGTCGIAAGARDILAEVMAELSRRNIDGVAVQTTGCIGMCQDEPLLDVIRGGQRVTYGRVKPEDVPLIIAEHVVNGRVVDKLAIGRAD